jgi:predicted aldo/keto reductase-like oxidoreductase
MKMQLRVFPKIPAQKVSILGFGCMRLPTVGGSQRIDEEKATRLLRQAVDAGVNYIDTAQPYHDGQSEPFVGRALKGGYREKVILATKLPVWLVKAEADWERLLDRQLQKLDADRIDVYLLHSLNRERWETVRRLNGLGALERAKADGRIGHIGFSFHDCLSSFKTIIDAYDWELCQIQYNFMDASYQAGREGLRHAAAKAIGVIAMEPLRGGALAARVPGEVRALWSRAPKQRTPVEWALRWIWNHPEITTALSSMSEQHQLEENLAIAGAATPGSLSAEEIELVDQAAHFYRSRIKVNCTTCGYCGPCPNGVAIPDAFSAYNACLMFDSKANASWYTRIIVPSGNGADACNDCGECESKCPQSISIREKLREAHAYLMR